MNNTRINKNTVAQLPRVGMYVDTFKSRSAYLAAVAKQGERNGRLQPVVGDNGDEYFVYRDKQTVAAKWVADQATGYIFKETTNAQ